MAQFSILDYNKARDTYRKTGNIAPVNQAVSQIQKQYPQNTAPRVQFSGQGQVLGASTSQGGGQQGGIQQGGQQSFSQPPMQEQPQQPNIDFDALIAPAIQGLEASIGPLNQGYQDFQQGEETGLKTSVDRTNQSIGAQSATLGQSRTKQQQMGESAIDEARRQFSEIQQGLLSRYGGKSGLGAFATEVAGGQTTKNISNIRQGLSSAMLEIDNKLQQVQEIGRIAIEDANNQSKQRVSQAKNQLDLAIADIRKQQGVLQADKARLASQAIQWYQGEVNRVESENKQFLQGLYVQQKNAEQQLQAAGQKAQGVAESYSLYNLSQGGQNTPVRIGNKTGQTFDLQGNSVQAGSGQLYSVGAQPKAEEDASGLTPEERQMLGL